MASSSLPTAVIAGGGPAGALCAKILVEQGFHVQLYESYPHPANEKYTEEKSKAYVISIGTRGQVALKRCGIDPLVDLEGAVVSEALVRHHSTTGKVSIRKPERGDEWSVVLVRRRALAASLLQAAEAVGANIQCGWRVKDVDFDKREVTVVAQGTNGTTKEGGENSKKVKYDLLVGADGVRSITRTLLSNHLSTKEIPFPVKTLDDTMEYQVAIIPRPWKEIILPQKHWTHSCPPASMHTWSDTTTGGTGLGFPIRRDSSTSLMDQFMVCVIFPGGKLGKMKQNGFSGYTAALNGLFADWTSDSRLDLAQLLAEDDNVPSIGGTCVWSEALSHPESGVVLIGDSGHGMWPSLGQGCNAALESVAVFADAIDAVKGSISNGAAGCRNVDFSSASSRELVHAISIEYDGLRQEDALAAVDLTFGGIGGTKVRGAPHSPLIFKLQMALFMIFNKLTIGLVPIPAIIRTMKGEDVRYSTLKWMNKMERIVTYMTVLGVLALFVSKIV